MEPIIAKTEAGWKCRKCGFEMKTATVALAHASSYHCIPADFVAMEAESGDVYDLRGVSLDTLREAGAL